jgi:hypothetical protein
MKLGTHSILELIFTTQHVILASILCHGKAQLPNLGDTVRTESSLRYLRGPGCYEVRRGIGIETGYVSSSKIQTGKISAEYSGSRAAYNSRRKMPGPFFSASALRRGETYFGTLFRGIFAA